MRNYENLVRYQGGDMVRECVRCIQKGEKKSITQKKNKHLLKEISKRWMCVFFMKFVLRCKN